MTATDGPVAQGPRPIGIGLVSVGWMGRLHSQSYQRVNYHYPDLPLRPRLVIAADTEPSRAADAVDRLGYAEATDDWRKVVAHPDVEALSITAPNHLHRDIAVAAAASGKHFWVEKPVGRAPAETLEIARAAEAAGVLTAAGFNYRLAPAVQRARELVRSGRIGRVTHARGVFLNDYAAEPRSPLTWRFRRSLAGSGALGDLMSHAVDLLQYIVGPVAEVSALSATVIPERPAAPAGAANHFAPPADGMLAPVENEDYVGALLRFRGGAVGTCEASRVTVGPRCQVGFEVYGTDGSVSWDFERMNELRACVGRSGPDHGYATVLAAPGHGDYGQFQPGPGIGMGYDDLKVAEAARFLRSIACGRQYGAGVAAARATALVLGAIDRASVSARWERVDEPGQEPPAASLGQQARQ